MSTVLSLVLILNPDPYLPSRPVASGLLSDEDLKKLSLFINPTYLTNKSMTQVNKRFIRNSSVKLKSFLRPDLAKLLYSSIRKTDEADKIGSGRVPKSYDVGMILDTGE